MLLLCFPSSFLWVTYLTNTRKKNNIKIHCCLTLIDISYKDFPEHFTPLLPHQTVAKNILSYERPCMKTLFHHDANQNTDPIVPLFC